MDRDDPLGGGDLSETFDAMRRDASGFAQNFSAELRAATEAMKRTDSEAKSLSKTLSSGLGTAFDKLVFGGGKLSDVFRGLGRSLMNSTLNSALKPVENALGSGVSNLFSSAVPNLFSGLFADGAAFSSGRVRAFANGGVVNGPTLFPMRGGTGLMGEAGPEAILPLTRGADGRLGVASGSGGGANITINISAQDVDSFRRSQSQIAATLARAVARGQRNL
jgi:phage-related minor tail protein